MDDLNQFARNLIESTRDYVFIRPEDRVIILRPNQLHYLNETATWMLQTLYAQEQVDAGAVAAAAAERYGVAPAQIEADLQKLLQSVALLLNNRTDCAPAIRTTAFGSHQRLYPVLSEIALTYRCQNRCFFCYASSPERGRDVPEMTTAQVCQIIDAIMDQAHVPTVSFTGGEPTLREDLPALIAHARQRGLRTNLITNGIACAAPGYVGQLADAGLHSAQVSLEAGCAALHDEVVGHAGAFERSVAGVRNLRAAGIHTHTNTTLNHRNCEALPALLDLIVALGSTYFSMNMVIRTGGAAGRDDIGYAEIGALIDLAQREAHARGLRFVWYSPVPYCLFNPPAHGLGSQGCAAADGLLSIAPDGGVLPCSSFEQSIGNLLTESFDTIWNRRSARYWRNKEFLPPGCRQCDMAPLCCGACPLYWDERGSFEELAGHARPVGLVEQMAWRARRRFAGQVKGVGVG
jgi:radical SAM protein with 4Fe4S-binding SPASM domain